MTKLLNAKIIIGSLLLLFFILIAIIGPDVAPHEEGFSKKITYIETSEGKKLAASPFSPSKEFLFGSDKWGYDILTLMLYGAKYTVFTALIAAFMRTLIGSLVGISHALSIRKNVVRRNSFTILSAVPTFIIIYFIMVGININPVWSPSQLAVLLGGLLVVFGVSGVYDTVFSRTMEIKKSFYIEAAQTLGGNRWHILAKHIFPSIKGQLMMIFVNEAIQILHLIGQLAIFNIFIGGTIMQFDPPIFLSITHEWSGMIGQSRSAFYYSEWIILFPLGFYMLFLLSLYIFSAGLKQIEVENLRKILHL